MSDMMTQEEAMKMSNEQAVKILIPMRNMMCDQNGCPISDAVFALDKAIEALSADRPKGEWIDCKEPPSTDRNVFIAYGTDDMKSVCIGHYRHDMKLWYEDKNFFAKPIYDAMYWCEIPQFPTRLKGADDENKD